MLTLISKKQTYPSIQLLATNLRRHGLKLRRSWWAIRKSFWNPELQINPTFMLEENLISKSIKMIDRIVFHENVYPARTESTVKFAQKPQVY